MKELEVYILDLFRSYKIRSGPISLKKLIKEERLEMLGPSQLQKYLGEKYHINLKYNDAVELELMILTRSYIENKYSYA